MGDPKHARKKYSKPAHPWQRVRIDAEKPLLKEFGLRNKREIWKIGSTLKGFMRQAKNLIALKTLQSQIESANLLKKLNTLGLLGESASLSDVLNLKINDLLERRLQTRVYRKGLARSVSQARQFIIHKHVTINGTTITTPSYLVHQSEEETISFKPTSSLSEPTHAERVAIVKRVHKPRPRPEGRRYERR